MKKYKVYIAGPLNALAIDYLHNVHRMMTVAEEARLAGFSVFVPALDMLMGLKFGYESYNDYFDNSQPWLEVADAVLLVPGYESSQGTKREMKLAKSKGIPVFESLGQLMKYFHGHEDEINEVGYGKGAKIFV